MNSAKQCVGQYIKPLQNEFYRNFQKAVTSEITNK